VSGEPELFEVAATCKDLPLGPIDEPFMVFGYWPPWKRWRVFPHQFSSVNDAERFAAEKLAAGWMHMKVLQIPEVEL
jgi:hypothetical protein